MELVRDLTELAEEAKRLVSSLAQKQQGATLLTLSGELGAGKTTFTQALARVFGVSESVQSPTFVLAKSYQTEKHWPKRILHIDAYRLSGFHALRPLDWEREVANKDTLILLEWPECVAPLSPTPDMEILFSVEANGGRTATLNTQQ